MNTCVIADGRKYWTKAKILKGSKINYITYVDNKQTDQKVAEFDVPILHCLDDLKLGQQYLGFNIIVSTPKNEWIGKSPDGFCVRIKKVESEDDFEVVPAESASSLQCSFLDPPLRDLHEEVTAITAALRVVEKKQKEMATYLAAYKRLWWWQRGKPPTQILKPTEH
jgi:hypothetical protein